MKIKHYLYFFLVILFITGCTQKGPAPFTAPAITDSLSTDYEQKVDQLLVIFDASASMADSKPFKFSIQQERSKINIAKDTLANLEQTLSGLNLDVGIRVFGPKSDSPQVGDTQLIYPLTSNSKTSLASAVEHVHPSGLTSLDEPILESMNDLDGRHGKIAVIIISDGLNENIEQNQAAIGQLKQKFGDNLCVYPIAIKPDTKGRKHLEELAKAGECGFVVDADYLAKPENMADYVEKVFLQKSIPTKTVTIKDSDHDGILDPADKCPDTPHGIHVDQFGCPKLAKKISITLDIKFDYDEDNIERHYDDELKEVADFMTKYPHTELTLEGYSDSYGSNVYNLKLSKRRAEEVEKYLVEKFGIAANRIHTVGYGYANPIATNDTPEGRQKNRRVVAVISNMND